MSGLMTVDFHGAALALVEKDGQPFVAMRTVVEGMGLSWGTQCRKLLSSPKRWAVEQMSTVAQDSKSRDAVCIPLRKLAAWLGTIQASKVREDLREKILTFQNECDDALWDYWTKGHAVNPRASEDLTSLPSNIVLHLSAPLTDKWIRVFGVEGTRVVYERIHPLFRDLPGLKPKNPQEVVRPSLGLVEPAQFEITIQPVKQV